MTSESTNTQTENDLIRIENAGGTIIAPNWQAISALHGKLAKTMASVGTLAASGKNQHFGYTYTTYDEAAAAIGKAMADAGLALTVSLLSISPDPAAAIPGKDRSGMLYRVCFEATFADSETGAMKVVQWAGESQDLGDKGLPKAITSGVKYLLLRTFLASAEEDRQVDSRRRLPAPPAHPAQVGAPLAASAARVASPQNPPARGGDGHSGNGNEEESAIAPSWTDLPPAAATSAPPDDGAGVPLATWLRSEDNRQTFWQHVKATGLHTRQALEILGVHSILEYQGTVADAYQQLSTAVPQV